MWVNQSTEFSVHTSGWNSCARIICGIDSCMNECMHLFIHFLFQHIASGSYILFPFCTADFIILNILHIGDKV